MHWKNKLILALLRPILACTKKRTARDRYLIISSTGLGDTLWATPAISLLRKERPNAFIAVLTSHLGKQTLANNPDIDQILLFSKKLSLLRALQKLNCSTIFIFHACQRIMPALAAFLRPTHLIGTKGHHKGLDLLFTQALPQKYQHEIARRVDLVQAVVPIDGPVPLQIFVTPREQQKANELWNFSSPVVGLHPGASGLFKRWPLDQFITLAKLLQKQLKCSILITGREDEREEIAYLCSKIEGATSFLQSLTITEFAAMVKKMTLMISNDTGPFHIACAVNTPVIGLYTPTDPNLCGPYHAPSARAISRKMTCTPCIQKRCPDAFCMRQIGADEVFSQAMQLLDQWCYQ